jgi:hypothetical protein
MMIPLGFFGGASKADFELIATAYGTGSSGTISFNSLSGLASTYKHLQVRATMRTTGGSGEMLLQFNNITSSSYAYHRLLGNGSSVTSDAGATQGSIYSYPSNWSGSPTDAHGALIMDIVDAFNTSKFKTVRSFAGYYSSAGLVSLNSGVFQSTSAIDSIQINGNGTNWATTSRFSLYGIRG